MFTSLFLKILNKEASSAKSKPEKIIASLDIREGYVIADIGSGGGYFTLVFARKTGKTGRVYAVDVKPKYLDFIRRAAARAGERAIRGPYQETFSIKLTFTDLLGYNSSHSLDIPSIPHPPEGIPWQK